MLAYIHRPAELHNLTFEKFFTQYHYTFAKPRSQTSQYYEINVENIVKTIYIVQRPKPQDHLVRISMVFPDAGELWYLRLILRQRAITSWDDAYSWPRQGLPGHIKHSTFQDAARAAGYLIEENEAFICFSEAVATGTVAPRRLRGLFIMMTADGSPTSSILKDASFLTAMLDDFKVDKPAATDEELYRMMLLYFKRRLNRHGKTLTEYGLDLDPTTGQKIDLTGPTELDEVKSRINIATATAKLQQLDTDYPNNTEQQAFIDSVKVRVFL